ncbi:papain-like cysteine protease family protein [Bradyrhizobium sp. RT3b]|uniref:papain-like cysteine protease family protein n=1 Tax=Bradyrhizobium sp. RT3b TaxID=3156334 RepID=UPI003399A459
MISITDQNEQIVSANCESVKLTSVHASTWKALDFHLEYQEKTNWCWAALALSVAKTYDPSTPYSQCEIANGELDRVDCCNQGKDDPCNVFGYLMSSLNRVDHFEKWNIRRPKKSKRLAHQVRHEIRAEIRSEIDNGRPICARIVWKGGGAHFISIYGYAADTEFDAVAIADPWWGLSDIDWIDFPAHYRFGAVYTDSYHTRAP